MFYNCQNITNINLYYFDTSNIKSMSYMFSNTKLKNIDLTPLNTLNVKYELYVSLL